MNRIIRKLFILLFILITMNTKGQQKGFVKNFPEVFAGVEWNTTSELTGIRMNDRFLKKTDGLLD